MFLLIFFMMFFMIVFLYHTVYLHRRKQSVPCVPRKTKQTQQQHDNKVYKKDKKDKNDNVKTRYVKKSSSFEQTQRNINTLQNQIRVQRKLIEKSKKQLNKLNMELEKDLMGLAYLTLIETKRTKCKFCSLKHI